MIYIIIAIILFLIETEYNFRVNPFNIDNIEEFESKIDFVFQKNTKEKDSYFKKLNFRWKHTDSEKLFPKYRRLQIKRELFLQHCFRIFGESKLIDLVEKNKSSLIEKYGEEINHDLEIFEILIRYFEIYEFKKYLNRK